MVEPREAGATPEIQETDAEVVDQALVAGNLIWGVQRIQERTWISLIKEGIKCSADTYATHRFTPYEICFGLLSNVTPAIRRYDLAGHWGPKSFHGVGRESIGISIDRMRVIQKYPGQLEAIGLRFASEEKRGELGPHDYQIDNVKKIVWDIPIVVTINSEGRFEDEVRLRSQPEDVLEPIDPSFWNGVVTTERQAERIQNWTRSAGLLLNVPLISQNGRLLARSIG